MFRGGDESRFPQFLKTVGPAWIPNLVPSGLVCLRYKLDGEKRPLRWNLEGAAATARFWAFAALCRRRGHRRLK